MQLECLSSSVATSGNNIQSRTEISELVTIKVTTSSVLVSFQESKVVLSL